MTKFKLFLIALVVLIFLPLYIWVIEPTYQRYQIAGQAEAYFNEIPQYPGAIPVEKWLSFSFIGYGYRYSSNDDPDKIISFYTSQLTNNWQLLNKSGSWNSKDLQFKKEGDIYKLTISVSKLNNQPLTSPPYDLTVFVYKP